MEHKKAGLSPPFVFLGIALWRSISSYLSCPQHFLYFLPLPQGQRSLRPIRGAALAGFLGSSEMLPPLE